MVWLIGTLLLLTATVAGGWWYLFRLSLPRTSGALRAPGLKSLVTMTRDEWGIPHIQAESLADAVYALGLAHAQDRLWQMELQRRIAAGRLSELFGRLTLDADRFMRRLGLRQVAEIEAAAQTGADLALLEAYCRGVNRGIEEAKSRPPLEFRLLGIKPEPWTPADTLSWGKVMALSLIHNWEDELLRYRMLERVGPDLAARLEPNYPPGQPLTAAPGGPGALDSADELIRLFNAAKPFLMVPAGASNNWVIAGSRTTTGKPLLANDPHLMLQIPSTWYEAHLLCPETEVTGATLPGVPGVVIGHNRQVGWGFTDAFADAADLFLERWHPTEDAYEYQGSWEPATVRREEIRVKGEAPVVEQVYVTRHGPVMVGGPLGGGPAMALRWTALEPGHTVRAVRMLNLAENAEGVREALRHWSAPCLNMVYADTAGEIGLVMAGLVPVRKEGTGLTPVPGWTGEYDWTGYVAYDELPHVVNPACGYIVTANNKVVDREYPHHISWDYMPGYRAQRITDRIAALPAVSLADCQAIQMDMVSLAGLEFAALCGGLKPADPLEQQALEALRTWDGHLGPDSVGGAIYIVMQHHALRRAYGAVLGDELMDAWLGKGSALAPANGRVGRSTTALLRELQGQEPGFLEAGGWDDLLAGSLADAVKYLRQRLGDQISGWRWGALHRLKLSHPMAAVKPLHLIFRGVEAPIGGDMSTPCQTAYAPHQSFAATAWAPSYRQVVDFADLSRSVSIHPVGQSGHPGSPHYLDLFPLWLEGRFHPMLWGKAAVQALRGGRLELRP